VYLANKGTLARIWVFEAGLLTGSADFSKMQRASAIDGGHV